ncbi:MAG: dodecin domain-containing protein [Candidatus Scalindua sediminis]|nr:dodecin domain-containing protein [Candidatus Scalindua sediminis]HDY68704.1 dodecin domain-containing protein [Candidatus Scalindua sp.]
MAVARVTRITSSSPTSWQDAVQEGLKRANKTLRGITGLEIVSQKAKIIEGKITEYRVTVDITFILEG